ncbi:MAG: hypothetical protein ACI9OJ_005276 [Myxococcota bacterium]|jgi:hypothetical protein
MRTRGLMADLRIRLGHSNPLPPRRSAAPVPAPPARIFRTSSRESARRMATGT